jgi:maltoporin
MEQVSGVKARIASRILFRAVLFTVFLTVIFVPFHNAACDPAGDEIKDLKDQLRQAQEHIEALTRRLEAVEAKVTEDASRPVTRASEKKPDPSRAKAKDEDPARSAFRPSYAYDPAEDVVASSGTDEQLLAETEIPPDGKEAPTAHTTDQTRELFRKFKYYAEGFSFHGYLRSGYGASSKGGKQAAFQAPGSPSKYRLGNETETYGELLFAQQFNPESPGPFFDVNVRLAFETRQNTGSDPGNDEFSVREAYAEMGDFDWAPGTKFWAGERFYRRHDIYIIDYYFLDTSGYGGGVEDINLFDWGKLSVAYLGGSSDDFQLDKIGSVSKNSFDIRLSDFDVPFGKGMVWLFPSFVKGGTYDNGRRYNSAGGLAAGLMHIADKPFGLEGYNKLSFQYGMGTSADFNPNIQDPDPKIKDRSTFQVTESGVIQFSKRLAAMYTAVYRRQNDGSKTDNTIDWFSVGARPIYFFNEHLALAFEAGADHVNSRIDKYSDTLFKMTLAPELRIDNTFLGRPVLRAYATYATWGSDFKGRVGGSQYQDDTEGLSFGVQMEAWW